MSSRRGSEEAQLLQRPLEEFLTAIYQMEPASKCEPPRCGRLLTPFNPLAIINLCDRSLIIVQHFRGGCLFEAMPEGVHTMNDQPYQLQHRNNVIFQKH